MGMAASQARYIALSARKTNIEYEGQQINQSRLALSNQSANLFNQMMGMDVPTPPSIRDYTTVQYSFTDGANVDVLSNYYQLGTPDSDYNYVVTTYHNENVFTGVRKKLRDPQVQYTTNKKWTYDPNSTDNVRPKIVDKAVKNSDGSYTISSSDGSTHIFRQVQPNDDKDIEQVRAINLGLIINGKVDADTSKTADLALKKDVPMDIEDATKGDAYKAALATFGSIEPADTEKIKMLEEMLGTTVNPEDYLYSATANEGGPAFVKKTDWEKTQVPSTDANYSKNVTIYGTTDRYKYNAIDPNDKDTLAALKALYKLSDVELQNVVDKLKQNPPVNTYYTDGNYRFVSAGDYDAKKEDSSITQGRSTNGGYYSDGTGNFATVSQLEDAVATYNHNVETGDHDVITVDFMTPQSKATFSNYTKVGNCRLTELTTADVQDPDTNAEIMQIIKDMKAMDGSQLSSENIMACFDTDPVTGELIYKGGLYSFEYNGQKCYTTEKDLSISAGTSIVDNDIDVQQNKLAYYIATYQETKVESTQKALLETDGNGRFATMRLEDDSTVYTLNCEETTDEKAYDDAMNQYYYENALYEQKIQEINARTEVIHAQDRTLELRMEQLATEQSALQNEMEAVKKVVDKHVEQGFKTFGG